MKEKMEKAQEGTTENSTNSADGSAPEATIVNISSADACVDRENGVSEITVNSALAKNKVATEKKTIDSGEEEKCSCVIDVNAGGKGEKFSCNEEWVCRICHLSSDQSETVTELIQLGCSCKDELGIAHIHCSEAWFKVKGNRLCEICGETAKNVTGILEDGLMLEWNETILYGRSTNTARSRECWRSKPFCNFLMGCLVIAFVLPWFFRINIF